MSLNGKLNVKKKLKINTCGKSYSASDSPFYKLSSKKKLAELLHCSLNSLSKLSLNNSYNVFKQTSLSGKLRDIQEPKDQLRVVHTRIASLLLRIKIPVNIHSGKKGCSHVTNARQHIGRKKVLTTDLKSFFPTTSKEMIFRLFFYFFKMPGDLAKLLTEVCCYKDILPTGSQISMPLAYWANQKMFEELHRLSSKHDVCFSIYVDDMTFSGKAVNQLFLSTVSKIVKKHGHSLHPQKTNIYGKDDIKVITGVVIHGDELKVKNRQHEKIFEDMAQWNLVKNIVNIPSLKQRLVGRLSAASQINLKFKDKARTVLKHKLPTR